MMRALACISILTLCACSETVPPAANGPEQPSAAAIEQESLGEVPLQMELMWKAGGFSSPEGVAFQDDVLFVSNVAGEGSGKDGDGWISRLSLTGEVLEEKWVDGLDAPKGMAVRGDKLFVSDIDVYHIIDIPRAEIEKTHPVDGAGFLNDITVWQGDVYVSDSGTATIFQLDENGYKRWLSDERLAGVNGLTPLGDRLLIATMRSGSLFETHGDGDLTEIAKGMENADGIGVLDNGGYVVSSWPGHIWHVSKTGKTTEILNTTDKPIYQNDLTRVEDLIIVPNWQPGTVSAWRIVSGH